MAEGNGLDHQPVDTLFSADFFDAGKIKGLGRVIVREAPLADIWPYMGEGSTGNEFAMRVLAASLEINGRRYSYEEFGQIGMKHMMALQTLLPEVQKINGMVGVAEEEQPEKKDEGAEAAAAPEGSAAATAS